MILTIGGIKGGSGKTTLAINIAIARAFKKKNVLLVDADDQKSSLMWSEKRDETSCHTMITTVHLTGSSVLSQVKQLSKNYDDIIIDVGGRNTASLRASLLVCNIFLTPFRPRSLDVWTLNEIEELLSEATLMNPNLRAFSVLNQADVRGSDNQDAFSILKESSLLSPLPCTVSQRKVFANSASMGLTVLEYQPRDEKAIQEVIQLISKIYSKHI